MLEADEREKLREFLTTLYGAQAAGWNMSDEIFNLTFELLSDAGRCTDIMDLVPRPMPLGQEPIRWLKKEIRKMIIRKLAENKKMYVTCLKAAAYRMATRFHLAAQNL